MYTPSEAPRPNRAGPRLSAPVLSVRVLDDPDDLIPYTAAWEELSADALEPNVFYEPWMLLPALEAYGAGEELLFALVIDGDPRARPERIRLAGFFPLQRRRLHRRLPLSVLGLWQHVHCYLCTPLVRADCAGAVLSALFDRLNAGPRGASLVQFNHVLGSGPFARSLQACCQERDNPAIVLDSHERALFRPCGNGEHYLRSAMSGKRRRSLARKARRLAERGPIDYVTLERGGDVEEWADAFLRLEATGWKGESGTALACNPADRNYFRAILRAAFARDRLFLCSMCHAGAPIAFRCSFLAGDGAFAFKMTYDERYRAYSPGVLLEMEYVRRLHVLPGVRWMDSCTAADNRMMNQLWPCRRSIEAILVATGPGLGRTLVALWPWLRALRRRLTRSPPVPAAEFGRGNTDMSTSPGVDNPRSSPTDAFIRDDNRVFDVDPAGFREQFNRRPYLIPHRVAPDHRLFTLPRLIELARRLPEEYVEYNAGKVPVSIDSRLTPRNGLSIEETIRRIEEHCSWMVLKRVEQVAEYRAFLDQCLDEVQEFSEPIDPGMMDRAGAVFISSPSSVTPYHLDAEYNFLLQIRGTKTLHVFDANDRSILSEQELEQHSSASIVHRNLLFQDEYQPKAMVFELTPGRALHVPSMYPHWVQNGPNVSISFSAGFLTRSYSRKNAAHAVNRFLRRLGVTPASVGRSPWRDALKYHSYRTWQRLNRLFGRGEQE